MRSEQSQKLPGINRKSGYSRYVALLLAVLILGTWELARNVRHIHAQTGAPRAYLSAARQVETSYKGSAHARQSMSAGASALSMAAGDLDGDGIGDLAVGFATPGGGTIAIHHGNLDAFAPQSEKSFWAIAHGEFPSPYLPQADLIEIPVRPDFLAEGDLIGFGGSAVAAAPRGGNSIAVLSRGDSGSVELRQTLTVSGAITGMDAHKLAGGKYGHLAVGVRTAAGSRLLIYTGSTDGLSKTGDFPLSGDATSFDSADLDGDGDPDLLVVAGGQIAILHSASQRLEPIQTPFTVSSVALGRFLFDRNPLLQMALLASDGSLHIWAWDGLDSTPRTPQELQALKSDFHARKAQIKQAMQQHNLNPARAAERAVVWKEVESNSGVGVPNSSGKAPLMFRTRISNNGADDVLLLSAAKLSVVAHPTSQPGQAEVQDRSDLGADAVAAVPARITVDARPGVVYINGGRRPPLVILPQGDPAYTVNRFDDPAVSNSNVGSYCIGGTNDCSLREAIVKVNNSGAGTYSIGLPAGTYTLTQPRSNGSNGNPGVQDGTTGTLDVGYSTGTAVAQTVNIVGAGQNTTIIQGGTSLANSVDKVFSFNEDFANYSAASVSVSNLTIQNGFNKGNEYPGYDGYGGAFDFDTGNNGTSTLSLTNVTLNNNKVTNGDGGGFASLTTTEETAQSH